MLPPTIIDTIRDEILAVAGSDGTIYRVWEVTKEGRRAAVEVVEEKRLAGDETHRYDLNDRHETVYPVRNDAHSTVLERAGYRPIR